MKIRTKLFLSTQLIFLIFVFVAGLFVYFSLQVGFQSIEESVLDSRMKSAKVGIEHQVASLDLKVGDWAEWDDTYKFIQDKNEDFVASNLTINALKILKVSQMDFVDVNGSLVVSNSVDEETERVLAKFVSQETSNSSGTVSKKGLAMALDGRVFMYALRPILKSDGSGPYRGRVVIIKFLDDEDLKSLSEVVGVSITLQKYQEGSGVGIVRSENFVTKSVVLESDAGQKLGVLRGSTYRDVYILGLKNLLFVLMGIVFSGLVTSLIAYFQIYYLVVKGLQDLTSKLKRLVDSGFSENVVLKRQGNDEFSNLANMIGVLLENRHSFEESLNNEKKKVELYLSEVPAMIVVIGKNNEIEFANKAAIDVFGSRNVLHVQAENLRQGDYSFQAINGEVMVISWRVNTNGDTRVCVGVDVTEQREFEQNKEARIKELEVINSTMVDREVKMAELKQKISELEKGGNNG